MRKSISTLGNLKSFYLPGGNMCPTFRLFNLSLRLLAVGLSVCFLLTADAKAQNNLTGAFEGSVFDSTKPNTPVVGATVQFTYLVNGVQSAKQTHNDGTFYQG